MYYIHVEEIQMVELKVLRSTARSAMKEIVAEGPVEGLGRYIKKLGQAAFPTLDLQTAGAWLTLGIFKELGKQLKDRETQHIRDDAAAMMLGCTGDPLMEMNIAMYRLARELPAKVWEEYDGKFSELAERIHRNVVGPAGEQDLPAAFVAS